MGLLISFFAISQNRDSYLQFFWDFYTKNLHFVSVEYGKRKCQMRLIILQRVLTSVIKRFKVYKI
jgi:hypothetical protein